MNDWHRPAMFRHHAMFHPFLSVCVTVERRFPSRRDQKYRHFLARCLLVKPVSRASSHKNSEKKFETLDVSKKSLENFFVASTEKKIPLGAMSRRMAFAIFFANHTTTHRMVNGERL
jgi:hypothetical protein